MNHMYFSSVLYHFHPENHIYHHANKNHQHSQPGAQRAQHPSKAQRFVVQVFSHLHILRQDAFKLPRQGLDSVWVAGEL